MNCDHCGEPILATDLRSTIPNVPYHLECSFRLGAGSIAHLMKICQCYVKGSECGDPEGMTKRQAAQAALAYYQILNRQKMTAQHVRQFLTLLREAKRLRGLTLGAVRRGDNAAADVSSVVSQALVYAFGVLAKLDNISDEDLESLVKQSGL